MEVSQEALAFMLLCSLVCGIALGGVYDILRITRQWMGASLPLSAERLRQKLALPRALCLYPKRKKKQTNEKGKHLREAILLFFEDVLFCAFAAVIMILLLYQTNDGQLRLSAIAAAAVGVVAYLFTVGRLVKLVSAAITVILGASIRWAVAIVLYPFAWLARLIYRWTAPLRRWIREHLVALRVRLRTRFANWRAAVRSKRQKHDQVAETVPTPTLSEQIRSRGYDAKRTFVSGHGHPSRQRHE